MIIDKKDGNKERRLITAMIVDSVTLGAIAQKWESPGFFRSRSANLIANWCVRFYKKYGRAPGKEVEGLFEHWADKSERDQETKDSIESLLASLSGEYVRLKKTSQSQYMIDLAGDYFTESKLKDYGEQLDVLIRNGDVAKADALMRGYSKIELGVGSTVNVLEDNEAWSRAFTADHEPPLVVYPDSAGQFYQDILCRNAFIAFEGQTGIGKCVAGNTEVILSDGTVDTIARIVKTGKSVSVMALNERTGKFIPTQLGGMWNNGIKDCWRVRTRTGRTISTTANHLYLTPDGWKKLEDLKPGDLIATPRHLPVFGTDRMNSDEVKYLAYMIAEGCCVYHRKAGELTGMTACAFTNADPIIVRDFKRTCRRLDIGYRDQGLYSLGLRGKPAREILRRHGVLGCSAKTKLIPSAVFRAPKDQVALFLRLLFSCDGSIFGMKHRPGLLRIELTLTNKKLVKQVAHLLTRFGVVSHVCRKDATLNGVKFPAWRLSIGDQSSVNRYLRRINFFGPKYHKPRKGSIQRSTLDQIPWQAAERALVAFKQSCPTLPRYDNPGSFYRVFGRTRALHLWDRIRAKLSVTRHTFVHVADHPAVKKHISTRILWDKIVSIKPAGTTRTYDLGVPVHHNFIANDIVVHNSWILQDIAWRAMEQGHRVAMFQCGDMSEDQILMRIAARIGNRPIKAGEVKIPISIEPPRGNEVTVIHKVQKWEKDMTKKMAMKYRKRLRKKSWYSKEPMRLETYPARGISIYGIKSRLDQWAAQDWNADVVVIDYADILAPPSGQFGDREDINTTWITMRSISVQYHCLVATATQVNRGGYDSMKLKLENTADDRRKMDHVTASVGLTGTEEEVERGIFRHAWIKPPRRRKVNMTRTLFTAGALEVANPCILSIM